MCVKSGVSVLNRYTRVNVTIAYEWKELILKRAKELGFSTISDYIQHLIRKDLVGAGYLKVNI